MTFFFSFSFRFFNIYAFILLFPQFRLPVRCCMYWTVYEPNVAPNRHGVVSKHKSIDAERAD